MFKRPTEMFSDGRASLLEMDSTFFKSGGKNTKVHVLLNERMPGVNVFSTEILLSIYLLKGKTILADRALQ